MEYNYDEFVNGEGNYAVMLDVIRSILCKQHNMKLGGVAFYNFSEKDKTSIKVFPLNEDVLELHFPKDNKIRYEYLKAINKERPYEDLFHLKHFQDNYKNDKHFDIIVDKPEKILFHDEEKINGKSWKNFIKQQDDPNILDQLFFNSGLSSFRAIPIPILTSPAILLVVPNIQIRDFDESALVSTLSEFIHHHLFNRLLVELKDDLKPGVITSKEQLVARFVKELSEICIPIKYTIGQSIEHNCFDWFKHDYEEACIRRFKLNLADLKVCITLPRFRWLDGNMIDNTSNYTLKEDMVRRTITNIFNLVYDHWKVINSQRGLIENDISNLITDLRGRTVNLDTLSQELVQTNKNLEQLERKISSIEYDDSIVEAYELIGEIISHEEDKEPEISWTFRYDGKVLYANSKLKGWKLLQKILEKPNQDIHCTELELPLGEQIVLTPEFAENSRTISEARNRIDRLKENEPDAEDIKNIIRNYALIIQAKNSSRGNVSNIETKEQKEYLNMLLKKGWLDDLEYNTFVKEVKVIQKVVKKHAGSRPDEIVQNLRTLRTKILKQNPQCENHFGTNSLKLGVTSKYSPKTRVYWKLVLE